MLSTGGLLLFFSKKEKRACFCQLLNTCQYPVIPKKEKLSYRFFSFKFTTGLDVSEERGQVREGGRGRDSILIAITH